MDTPLTPEQEATLPTTSPERLRELAYQNNHLSFLVAQSHYAPSELLRELANIYKKDYEKDIFDGHVPEWTESNPRFNSDILQAITANPNTPLEVLLELGAYYPQKLLINPIFEILWLENPNLTNEMPLRTLRALLALESIPIFVLESALNSPKKSDVEVRKIVASHSNTPVSLLATLAQDFDTTVRSKVAANRNTPVNLLKTLSMDIDANVRSGVAENPNTPNFILGTLTLDSDSSVRRSVAQNLNTPPKLLLHLTAEFPQCWDDTFFNLLALEYPDLIMDEIPVNTIRSCLEHESTPKLILKVALESKRVGVRRLLANSLNTPISSLGILAQDADDTVRLWVARNPKTPFSVLEILSKDGCEQVRSKALKRLKKTTSELLPTELNNFILHQMRLSLDNHYAWQAKCFSFCSLSHQTIG